MNLRRDYSSQAVQVFAPVTVVTVTSGTAWEPDDDYCAYCTAEDVDYTIDTGSGASSTGTVLAGFPRGIIKGASYVFASTINIEVM